MEVGLNVIEDNDGTISTSTTTQISTNLIFHWVDHETLPELTPLIHLKRETNGIVESKTEDFVNYRENVSGGLFLCLT